MPTAGASSSVTRRRPSSGRGLPTDAARGSQAPLDAPRHHTEAFPSSFYPRATRPRHVTVEDRAGEATLDGLRRRGHDVEAAAAWSLGRVTAVGREPDGLLKGGDPRSMQ